jgi:hypothetical protein
MRLCTLANIFAVRDIKVLFETLKIFQKELPEIYILTDAETRPHIEKLQYPKVHYILGLERYRGLNRRQMEALPGTEHPTLFGDFTAEKCGLLEIVGGNDLMFVDTDICFLGPLPVPPKGKKLGLSPHMIRKRDTDRFGLYNAGFLWTSEPAVFAAKWRKACKTSRFFEQGCLEDLYAEYKVEERFEFGKEHNFGWWRMLQSDAGKDGELAQWNIHRMASPCGILVKGTPLGSIHTHWDEKDDQATLYFNMLIYAYLKKVKSLPAISNLLKFLEMEFPHLLKN